MFAHFSGKPKSYKLQYWKTTNEYQFNDDVRKYKSIRDIVSEYSKSEGKICLQECLPPSEYGNRFVCRVREVQKTLYFSSDKSPLLLCRNENFSGDALTDSSSLGGIIPASPVCINSTDLQVYKGKDFSVSFAKRSFVF